MEDINISTIIKIDMNNFEIMRQFRCKPGEFHRRFQSLSTYSAKESYKIVTCGDYGIRVYHENT